MKSIWTRLLFAFLWEISVLCFERRSSQLAFLLSIFLPYICWDILEGRHKIKLTIRKLRITMYDFAEQLSSLSGPSEHTGFGIVVRNVVNMTAFVHCWAAAAAAARRDGGIWSTSDRRRSRLNSSNRSDRRTNKLLTAVADDWCPDMVLAARNCCWTNQLTNWPAKRSACGLIVGVTSCCIGRCRAEQDHLHMHGWVRSVDGPIRVCSRPFPQPLEDADTPPGIPRVSRWLRWQRGEVKRQINRLTSVNRVYG